MHWRMNATSRINKMSNDAQNGAFRRRRVHIRKRGRDAEPPILEAVTIEGPRRHRRPAAAADGGVAFKAAPPAIRRTTAAPAHVHSGYGQMATGDARRVNLVA